MPRPIARLFALTLVLAGLLVPAPVFAACMGRDLLSDLSTDERQALDTAVAAAPYAIGNHWRATKGSQTIDVIGTLHVYDPRMDEVMDELRPVIKDADLVLLEATGAEIAELKKAMATRPELMLTTGPTLPERLSAEEWATVADALNERGVPAFVGSKMQPWFVSMMLGMPPCMILDMAGGELTGLDKLIMDAAEADDVPMKALEPFDTVFRMFGHFTPEEQIDIVRASLPLVGQSEDMLATSLAAYFREDHRLIWEYLVQRALAMSRDPAERAEAEKDADLFAKMLVTDRNRAWVGVIEGMPLTRHLVVAVGAGHLGGENGVLNLLAQKGYHLERAPFR